MASETEEKGGKSTEVEGRPKGTFLFFVVGGDPRDSSSAPCIEVKQR